MNCQEALTLLYDIIDKEASEIDAAEVRAHLDKCEDCLQKYNLATKVNALIDERLKSAKATCCTESIRRKLINQIDEIDRESGNPVVRTRRFPFGNSTMVIAIAAAIVIAIGGFYVSGTLVDHHKVFKPLEQAHWDSAGQVNLITADIQATTEAFLLASAEQYKPNATYGDFSMIGAKVEDLLGEKMGHFVYEHGTTIVSVFVAPASFEIPSQLESRAVMVGGIKMFDHNCRGCRLVYHRTKNAVVIVATTEKSVDLLSFDPGRGAI